MQIRGSKAGGALRLSLPCKSFVVIPGSPSARLDRCLKLNTGQWQTNDVCWLLRFSILKEPPTAPSGVYKTSPVSSDPQGGAGRTY